MHCSFRSGAQITVDGHVLKIVYVNREEIQARNVASGKLHDFMKNELLAHYSAGRLRFDASSLSDGGATEASDRLKVDRSLADFPEKVRANAIRKWKYLSAICPDGRLEMPRAILKQMIVQQAVSIDRSDPDRRPPSLASFYSWRKKWMRQGQDIRALIDKWELRGGRPKSNFPERVVQIINHGIDAIYLTPQRESRREVHDWVNHQVALENRKLPPEAALPKVSARTIKRFIDQLDRYEVLKARYGERYASAALRTYGKGPQCERPLERVEVDHTPLDVLTVDLTTGLVLGRPWITVMIDRYTRMVVGIHVTFRKPSVTSVLRCLRNAVRPKTYVKERFPAIQGEWNCYGLIETLVCDNGLEFHAKDLEAACGDLSTHLVFCPTRQPHLKGAIERFLKTLNYGLLHLQPGTTFSTYYKREGYDANAFAVLTFDELEEVLHRWIIDVYGCEFHRGIQAAPLQRWEEARAKHPPGLPPDSAALDVYCGTLETRLLDPNGVKLHSLQYQSPALQELWRRTGDMKATIRANPDDLGRIYVLDPTQKAYIEAHCTWPDYAAGLTLEQHVLIVKKARLEYASLPWRDRLLCAKAALRELTSQLLAGRRAPKGKKQDKALTKEVLQANAMSALPTIEPAQPSLDTSRGPDDSDLFAFDIPLFSTESIGSSAGRTE